MKYTKNAETKKKGDKITFRVNTIEDREIIRYIDRAKNGSAFIKEAIKFYIMALEKGLVTSYYLENTNQKWETALNGIQPEPKEIPNINHTIDPTIGDMTDLIFKINDFNDPRLLEEYGNDLNTYIDAN